jgi:N-acetylglucosaminyl-diphospho-decaprenol L-rhamnosyltransferase
VLGDCLEAIRAQSRQPDLVIVVDNCSPEPAYLQAVPPHPPFRLLRQQRNEGFCGGNNIGFASARVCKYVLFLNPDAFLSERFIEDALGWMERPENAAVGCLTGTLLGYDVKNRRPTGLLDSTGIFQRWYGRWYDRGRGASAAGLDPAVTEEVPAACGALMFCRTAALEQVALQPGIVFDPRYFMYKEDIELCLRLRAGGWRVIYRARLTCAHGRGWEGRQSASYRARYLSARNELRVTRRNRLKGLPYSLLKYAYVSTLEPLLQHLRGRGASRSVSAPSRSGRGRS